MIAVRVVARLDADAECRAHRGVDAVGGHYQARPQEAAGCDPELDRILANVDRRHAGRTEYVEIGAARQTRPEGRAERTVRHDVTQRAAPELRRVDAGEAEMPPLRDVDLRDRGRRVRHILPDPQGLENAAAAIRQRRGALIEARLRGRIVRHRLDEGRAHAKPLQGDRETRAHHAAADDGDVVGLARGLRAHDDTRCSIASHVFSNAAVNTSGAPPVTRTSSSMRAPMFQNSFGTRGAGRM